MRSMFRNGFAGIALVLLIGCGATNPDSVLENSADKIENMIVDESAVMTRARMEAIIQNFDKEAVVNPNRILFKLREREFALVYDTKADRMRVMSPVMQSSAIPAEIHERMLKANFDAVLDARYALANDLLWSVFIHRLSTLSEDDLKSGIAQTYTATETFGTTYTSGAIVYGGGDSNSIHKDLLEELENIEAEENQDL